jgi:hypothetical protein
MTELRAQRDGDAEKGGFNFSSASLGEKFPLSTPQRDPCGVTEHGSLSCCTQGIPNLFQFVTAPNEPSYTHCT